MNSIDILKAIQNNRTFFGYEKDGLLHIFVGHKNPVASWHLDACSNFDLTHAKKTECPFVDEIEEAISHLNSEAEIVWSQ